MARKTLINPVKWRSVNETNADADVGLIGEPVIDWRNGKPYLRIMNGELPGGKIVGEGLLDVVTDPTILYPLSGSINLAISPVFTSSPFSTVDTTGEATHLFSIWEISTDINFTNIVYNSGTDFSSLTTLDLFSKGVSLEGEQEYFIRVKYISSNSYSSNWSEVSSFTTSTALPLYQNAKLISSDNNLGDYFGYALDISDNGDVMVVGSYGADSVNTDTGAIFVLTKVENNWVETAKLTASDATTNDYFGYDVAISGDGNTIIAGSPLESDADVQAGAIYVFKKTNGVWSQTKKIVSTSAGYLDRLGVSCSIDTLGTRMAVGAAWKSSNWSWYSGAIFVFRLENDIWVEEATLTSSTNETYGLLGRSVGIDGSGSFIVAGCSYEDVVGSDSGSAYVFTRVNNSWSQTKRLIPSDGSAGSFFGEAIAISGDGSTVVVGAWRDDDLGSDTGAIYIFDNKSGLWIQRVKLKPSDVVSGVRFGSSVNISPDGNTVIAGAYRSNFKGNNSGAAYIFTRNGLNWSEQSRLLASDGGASDYFGISVAISGNGLAVSGAYGLDGGGSNSGGLYVYGS